MLAVGWKWIHTSSGLQKNENILAVDWKLSRLTGSVAINVSAAFLWRIRSRSEAENIFFEGRKFLDLHLHLAKVSVRPGGCWKETEDEWNMLPIWLMFLFNFWFAANGSLFNRMGLNEWFLRPKYHVPRLEKQRDVQANCGSTNPIFISEKCLSGKPRSILGINETQLRLL